MISKKWIPLSIAVLFINSCASTIQPEGLPIDAILPQSGFRGIASEMPKNSVSFEQAINQKTDGLSENPQGESLVAQAEKFKKDRRTYGMIGAFRRICKEDKNHPFCVAYEYKNTPYARSSERKGKLPVKTIHKHFKDKNYNALKDTSFSSLLAATRKLKFEQLKSTARDVLDVSECLSEDLYTSLGSILELDFPADDVVALNNRLLGKASSCHKTDSAQLAGFRLSMFRVWKENCNEALPIFDEYLKTPGAKTWHARSTYWKSWCKGAEKSDFVEKEKESVANFYKNFPNSYNNLLADDGPMPIAYDALAKSLDPVVKMRSDNNPKFNALLETLDAFIRVNDEYVTMALLQDLKVDQLEKEEPQALLYLAILCHRVQFGLFKFKLMAHIFDRQPQFKTLNTMKLFYPAWYLDVVRTYKDQINPYLIMALIRQESAFNPKAHSVADARGLMQILPVTGKQFGRVDRNDLFVPKKNIAAGVKFFSYLMKRYNNQVHLALAAYNAGPTNVDRWLKRYPTDNTLLFTDMIPFRETRDYVGSILRNWYWYHELYSVSFPAQQASIMESQGAPGI